MLSMISYAEKNGVKKGEKKVKTVQEQLMKYSSEEQNVYFGMTGEGL